MVASTLRRTIITILLALVAVAGQAQEPFFCTDSAVVRGRIVDYSPAMGFQNLTVQVTDIFTGELKTATAEIREDGTQPDGHHVPHQVAEAEVGIGVGITKEAHAPLGAWASGKDCTGGGLGFISAVPVGHLTDESIEAKGGSGEQESLGHQPEHAGINNPGRGSE